LTPLPDPAKAQVNPVTIVPHYGQACLSSLQGEVPNLSLPFAFSAAFRQQQDVLDSHANLNVPADLKYPRHGEAGANTLECVSRETGSVVREQDPPFARRPSRILESLAPERLAS
jgi:hypothetical protein